MSRMVGTVSRGIRAPIIRDGDNLVEIVVESLLAAAKEEPFAIRDRDIVAVTEAVVGRAQRNYATVDDISTDVRRKLGDGTIGGTYDLIPEIKAASRQRKRDEGGNCNAICFHGRLSCVVCVGRTYAFRPELREKC